MKKIGILGLNDNPELTFSSIENTNGYKISGIYHANATEGFMVAESAGLIYTNNPFGLINNSDLLIIPKSDEYSYNLMVECILNSKHLLIEKPENLTLTETEHLSKLGAEASTSVIPFVTGHFNPCLINLRSYIFNPSYIQISFSNDKQTKIEDIEKNAILLNIIDTALNLAKASVKRSFANAVRIFGDNYQFLNARIEFDNGCIANIAIDYISGKNDFSIQVYQPYQIVDINMLKNNAVIKTFDKNDIYMPELNQVINPSESNPYAEVFGYLYTLETLNIQVGLMENFKNSLNLFKKIQDKIQ